MAPDLDDAHARPAAGHALRAGTRLRDYEVTGLIDEGGFGIVYLALDHSLQRKVALKEYLPSSIAARVAGSSAIVVKSDRHLETFKAGLKSFVNEARLLARFDHPSLVKAYRFWEENGTAYMVMPFYEGPTLKAALAELGHVPGEGELRTWLRPILNAISSLHDAGFWHQNIGPGEIVLTAFGPVLLGFASARHAIAAMNHTPAAALLPGFAAIEQYGTEAGTTRGPWTDLYALAAVIYVAITGTDPAPADERLAADHALPLSLVAAGLYSPGFLAAVDAALSILPEQRPRSHAEFRALMGDIEAPDVPSSLAPRRDLMQEPFLGNTLNDRQITVPDRPLLSAAEPALPVAVASETRPRMAPSGPHTDSAPLRSEARAAPSWAKGARSARRMGKRALYGIVAVTCALIGVLALGLQYYGRQAARGPAAAIPPASAVVATSPAATGSATPTVSVAATRPVAALAPVAAVAASATVVVAPPVPAPAPLVVPTPAPAPLVKAAAPTPDAGVPPGTSVERQAHCIEILQKASLERITADETEFFKRECK